MATIERIVSIQQQRDSKGKKYFITLALVDSDEVTGWSAKPDTYKIGTRVEVFYDDRYQRAKMRLTLSQSKGKIKS